MTNEWPVDQVVRAANEVIADVLAHPENYAAEVGGDRELVKKAAGSMRVMPDACGIDSSSLQILLAVAPFVAEGLLLVASDIWRKIVLPRLERRFGPR